MKLYSLRNKCFSNHNSSLNLQTEEKVKNMITGMPKSTSTKIETFKKSIGGSLLNSLSFNEPSKKLKKDKILSLYFRDL